MRLLILTYAFPPSRHTNAKRPYYMARAFAEAGWEVDVYTGPLGMVPGDSELPGHPALRVFRVGDWITDMLQKPGQRGPLRSLFTKVLFGLMWPDPYAPWVLRTLRACGGGKGYDRVLVYIFPASLLLCGAPRNLVTRQRSGEKQLEPTALAFLEEEATGHQSHEDANEQRTTLAGQRQEIAPKNRGYNKQALTQRGEGPHLFSPTGFLDDTWWHRSYWVYGRSFAEGAGGWPLVGRLMPGGRGRRAFDRRI